MIILPTKKSYKQKGIKMKKYILPISKRILSLLLLCSLITSVSAATPGAQANTRSNNGSSDWAIHLPDDIGGDGNLLFTMTAGRVYNLITTSQNDEKWIRISDLPNDVKSLFFSGTLYSSNVALGGNYRIYVGICYYSAKDDKFINVKRISATHGEYFDSDRTRINVSDLERDKYYYGFIENNFPNNNMAYTWGEVSFFSSKLAG